MITVFPGRIHFSIHYPDLDIAARLAIWKMFIERADGHITDPEIDKLAKHVMNGRQVRCSSPLQKKAPTPKAIHTQKITDVWNPPTDQARSRERPQHRARAEPTPEQETHRIRPRRRRSMERRQSAEIDQ